MALTTLTFDGESTGDFTMASTMQGFTYAPVGGSLFINNLGNPMKDVEGSTTSPGNVILDVKSSAAAQFTYSRIDFAAFANSVQGLQTLTISGYLNGTLVGTDTYSLANTNVSSMTYSNWTTEAASALAGHNIDDLKVTFSATSSSYTAIDNLALNSAVPIISGTTAGLTTTNDAPISPFASAAITDPNAGAMETLTISLSGRPGTLAVGQSSGTLTLNSDGTYTLQTGTASAVTAELESLIFTPAAGSTTSTTTFSLLDESSAGTSATDATTTVTDGTTPVDTPVVSFDPSVSFFGPNTAALTGTASAPSGIDKVEIFDGTVDLGAAKLFSSGAWSFTFKDGPGLHDDITAVATSNNGGTATADSGYDLTTGIGGQPYTAIQDTFDALGRQSTETFFRRFGAIYLGSYTDYASDGSSARTTDSGNFFNNQPYFAYIDKFAANGTQTEEDVFYKDGTQTVQGLLPNLTLNSISDDTFFPDGGRQYVRLHAGFRRRYDHRLPGPRGGSRHDQPAEQPVRRSGFRAGAGDQQRRRRGAASRRRRQDHRGGRERRRPQTQSRRLHVGSLRKEQPCVAFATIDVACPKEDRCC